MKPVPSVPRWTDGGSAEPEPLRAALLTMSDEGPSDAQLERLIGAVSARVSIESAPGVEPPAVPRLSGALKLVVLPVSAALLWWSLSFAAKPAPPEVIEVKERAPMITAPSLVPMPDPEPSPEPAPSPEPSPRPRRALHAKQVERAPDVPSLSAARPTLADEIALLRRAKRALSHDPRASLELLQQHRAGFDAGAFAEERDALEVEALHGLGRTSDAAHKRAAFRARYPSSAYLRRIDALFTAEADPL